MANWFRRRKVKDKLTKLLPRGLAVRRYMWRVFRQMKREGQLTSAHNWGHVTRVAYYASEYARVMGGTRKVRKYAKAAGLAHDRFRDAEDSMKQAAEKQETHEEKGAKFMGPIFEKRYNAQATQMMVEAIGKHGAFPALNEVGKNLVRDGVVYADKFFEANGAYIAFRRAMFMGERNDLRKKAAEKGYNLNTKEGLQRAAIEFTLEESIKRVAAFSDLSKIPSHLHPFVKYQVEWQKKLIEGLKKMDSGIVNLVTVLYAEGLKSNPRDLGAMIKKYRPISSTDKEFKKEALRYLNGDLAKTFRALTKP
jgi:HD superfamily phosphodiesterase